MYDDGGQPIDPVEEGLSDYLAPSGKSFGGDNVISVDQASLDWQDPSASGEAAGGTAPAPEQAAADANVDSAAEQGQETQDAAGLVPEGLTLDGSNKADVLEGAAGNDVIHGNRGDDTINGHGGSDALYGDAGNDLFVFGDVSGHTTVDGGGGHWTDVVEIDFGHGPAASTAGGGWTLEIDGQQVTDGRAHGSVEVGDDHHATITTQNGTINLDHIDKIEW